MKLVRNFDWENTRSLQLLQFYCHSFPVNTTKPTSPSYSSSSPTPSINRPLTPIPWPRKRGSNNSPAFHWTQRRRPMWKSWKYFTLLVPPPAKQANRPVYRTTRAVRRKRKKFQVQRMKWSCFHFFFYLNTLPACDPDSSLPSLSYCEAGRRFNIHPNRCTQYGERLRVRQRIRLRRKLRRSLRLWTISIGRWPSPIWWTSPVHSNLRPI